MYDWFGMQELWSSESYEPHLLSLPFAFAPALMLVVISYALVMRGEPKLRGWLLLHYFSLLPYALTVSLAPSIVSQGVADRLFRIAGACIPMAAAAGAGFQYQLIGLARRRRWWVWAGVFVAIAWLVIGVTTNLIADGVRWLPAKFWYAKEGPLTWLILLTTLINATPAFAAFGLHVWKMKPGLERRQLGIVLAASLITYSALSDVALVYDIGVFPFGWVLSGIGSVLVLRALLVEDVLRVRAIDTTAPKLVFHFTVAVLLGWVSLRLLGPGMPWWLTTAVLAISFAGVRTAFAIISLINRGARASQSTLDRLVTQLVTRSRPLESEAAIAQLAVDIVELGVGARADILLAAAEDYSWTTADGTKLADDAAPDPLLGAWLAERRAPVFRNEPEDVPADLRELLDSLFDRRNAHTLVPVANNDELLAIVMLPTTARRVRGRELAFLRSTSERLGEALVHARMAHRAAERAQIAREVELAATVQAQLLPGPGPHVHGDITVVGSWLPAARCAGDFWGVYPLGEGRVLVAVGDVTGHGVASAMVTAAASSAVDVTVRRHGAKLVLPDLIQALDAAVRRVGGGQLSMTCFAAIIDPDAREIRFISCGHTTPYLIRANGEIELQALVGRGNPLGGSGTSLPKVLQKPLRAGDLVVWYTDGVIEAQDPLGEPFGDRRLQRMLRRLDRSSLSPPGVHHLIYAGVATHRGAKPRGDDETLIVAQWKPQIASLEPSKEVSG
jgi:serine phosphatase RsbU (regulator of sigma subunit)